MPNQPFWKEEAPSRIRVYPCPSCRETISVEATSCRFCNLPIDSNTAQKLLADSQRVTTAISRANTFSLSTRAAALLIAFVIYQWAVDGFPARIIIAVPFLPVAYGVQWLYANRSLVTHDADFPAAVKKVKWTIVVWIAVLVFQVAAYLIARGLIGS